MLRAAHFIGQASKLTLSHNRRCSSTDAVVDLGARLQADLKIAMKAKDTLATTTIRSVLSEIYGAQKQSAPAALNHSEVACIIRKAEMRRLDAVKQFEAASRPDLAQHERKEANLLAKYLPARLSADEIDRILREIIAQTPETNNRKITKGLCIKAFFAQVDRNTVDMDLLKRRIDDLWSL